MPKICPWCGSDDVVTEKLADAIAVPYGPSVQFFAITNTCNHCGEAGDFESVNDAAITRAKESSITASVSFMLDDLSKNNCTMAYMERSLGLPARTIARWKAEGSSAAPVALLRMVTTFPWLLEVADNKYDPHLARAILVREAGKALVTTLKEHRVGCVVAASSGRGSATINLTFSKPEFPSPQTSAVEVLQLPCGYNARS